MPKPHITDPTKHAMEWRHLWSVADSIAVDAPGWMQSDCVFRHLSECIDISIVRGNLTDMETSTTSLYLHCIKEVRERGIAPWWK